MTNDAPATSHPTRGRRPVSAVVAVVVIAVLAVVVLAADQLSKQAVLAQLTPGQPVQILGDALVFVLVFNPGAAFSIGEGVTWIFTIALALVAGVIVYLAITRVRSRAWAITLGLLLGGVLGNLTDRLFRDPGFAVGHVVDFISTPWMMPAVYNVADIFIVCDMIAVAILILIGVNMNGRRDTGDGDESTDVSAEQDALDETLLGAGDEFPPGGGVVGFGGQFPVNDPDEGVPADERGLPPLSESEQLEVEREADRIADETRRNDA